MAAARSVWRMFAFAAFSAYSKLIVQIISVSVIQCHTIYINIFPAFCLYDLQTSQKLLDGFFI